MLAIRESDAMNIIRRRGWELPERLVTQEALVLNRRGAAGRAPR